jgi:hypothetical protein
MAWPRPAAQGVDSPWTALVLAPSSGDGEAGGLVARLGRGLVQLGAVSAVALAASVGLTALLVSVAALAMVYWLVVHVLGLDLRVDPEALSRELRRQARAS